MDEIECNMGLFAEDLLLFVLNLQIAFPSLMEEFEESARVSNFKVNTDETEALNVSLPVEVVDALFDGRTML